MILHIDQYLPNNVLYTRTTMTINSIVEYEKICKQYDLIMSFEDMMFDIQRDEVVARKLYNEES